MSDKEIVLLEIQKLKDAGNSNSAIERLCGLSNGVVGKILSGTYVITEKTKNKVINKKSIIKAATQTQQDDLARLQSVSNSVGMFVPNSNGLDVLAQYMLKNGIIYTDLIEAYEAQKKAINETLKDKEPLFKPSSNLLNNVPNMIKKDTDSQRIIRWGWNLSEYNAYKETVIPRLYKAHSFQSIITEEDNNIELMKLGAEILKAYHLDEISKNILIKDIVVKLNQSLEIE